jgi:protein TonB
LDTIPETKDHKEGELENGQPSVSSKIFESSGVDVKATVDVEKWKHHLQKTLQSVLTSASKQGIPDGDYTVTVKFVVEGDGTVSNAKAKNDPGYGLAEGAVKVVTTGPKWKPALKNGEIVRSYRIQPITFVAKAAYIR